LYYSPNYQTALIDSQTGAIINETQLRAQTSSLLTCPTSFNDGPVVRLISSLTSPSGYYLRFVPAAGETGLGYQQIDFVVQDGSHVSTEQFQLVHYILNIHPNPVVITRVDTGPFQGLAFVGETFLLLRGVGFTGATSVVALLNFAVDPNITFSDLAVNADGTELTVTMTISPLAALGQRVLRVITPAGSSGNIVTSGNHFSVVSPP
jgi:hypothetical protein